MFYQCVVVWISRLDTVSSLVTFLISRASLINVTSDDTVQYNIFFRHPDNNRLPDRMRDSNYEIICNVPKTNDEIGNSVVAQLWTEHGLLVG